MVCRIQRSAFAVWQWYHFWDSRLTPASHFLIFLGLLKDRQTDQAESGSLFRHNVVCLPVCLDSSWDQICWMQIQFLAQKIDLWGCPAEHHSIWSSSDLWPHGPCCWSHQACPQNGASHLLGWWLQFGRLECAWWRRCNTSQTGRLERS